MARGTLRIYLGAAPGVGKTFAMLDEARRRAGRGADVVVGYVETHGRAHTAEKLTDLEVVPRQPIMYRDCAYEEMDLQAILRRRPQIVCVDELAHTNIPGSGHPKRWQDVEDLLEAGITVLTTVNIQHLESVNDVVEKITGIRQQETVPDAIVRGADQVELVDITPEALRRRMAHGNIYPAERIDAALGNYFRVGNLTALRELALLWLADKVDDALQQYRRDHDIGGTWETRERVVVALTGGPEGATLIRRAARIAARGGADLLALHITRSDGLTGASPTELAKQRQLVESLGGTYHQVVGDHIPEALLDFARSQNATQLVMGASRRSLLATYFGGPGIGATTVRLSGDIDVHIVTHEHAGRGRRLPELSSGLTVRRQLIGAAVAAILLPLTTVVLASARGSLNLTSDLLCYLLVVVAVSLVGGAVPGIGAAIVASLLLNYYFTPPLYQFTIAESNNVIALVAFIIVAAAVSAVVDLAARRTSQAARALAESQTLSTLAGSVLRGQPAMPALLERLVEAMSLSSASVLERDFVTPGVWRVIASVGPDPVDDPDSADAAASADHVTVAVRGRALDGPDQRMLSLFALQAALTLEQQRLTDAAAAAEPLAEADRMRTALLSAVSHDLRSPLASATAAVDSLSNSAIQWTPEQRADLIATAKESLDQLSRLVDNLLDMSRLQAGALSVFPQPTRLDEVVPLALDSLGPSAAKVEIDMAADLPEVRADPALLERVIANVAANAIRYADGGRAPRVAASAHGDRVELRIIDHGPGVPSTEWDRIFTPFQRLGDTDNTVGVGLGLALARGLAEAMGGHLNPEETPGGGLTMVVDLPTAQVGRPVSVINDEVTA